MTPSEIVFFRSDGTPAVNSIASHGTDKDGNVMFFEIVGQTEGGGIPCAEINSKRVYRRIIIRRVFPYLAQEQEISQED